MKELTGDLVLVKEDSRNLVYEIDTDIQGLNGSIYLDKSYLPLFDKLVLEKEKGSNGSGSRNDRELN